MQEVSPGAAPELTGLLVLLFLVGLGWLGWRLTRHIGRFPVEFARLLDRAQVRSGPLTLLSGRSYLTGESRGRAVTLFFQREDEHQTGYAVISLQTSARDQPVVRVESLSASERDRDLARALFVLEATHALKVEVEAGWLRATWRPAGIFIFPGRFDRSKWLEVLDQMHVAASRLEVGEPRGAAPPPGPELAPSGGWPAGGVAGGAVGSKQPPVIPRARVMGPAGGDWSAHSTPRRGLRGPVLVLRLMAMFLIIVSASMLAASVAMGAAIEFLETAPAALVAFPTAAGVFAVILLAGSTATFVLSGWPHGLLINERGRTPGATAMPLGGWLWLWLVSLVALPAWMVVRLTALMALSLDVLRFLDEHGVWDMVPGGDPLSGLVLLPVLGVLSLPALELATAFAFVVSAVALPFLLITRSPHFPRVFLLAVALLAGLVASVQWATHVAAAIAGVFESAFPAGPETAQIPVAAARYVDVLHGGANTLTVVMVGFLAWTPALFLSHRVERTFWRGTAGRDG